MAVLGPSRDDAKERKKRLPQENREDGVREPDAGAYLASERGRGRVIDPKRGLCQTRSPARTLPGPAWGSSAIAGAQASPWRTQSFFPGISLGPALGACGRAFDVPFCGCPACSRGGHFSPPRLTRVVLWTVVPPQRATHEDRPQKSPEIPRPDRRGPFFCRRLILPRDRPPSRSSLLPANPPSHVRRRYESLSLARLFAASHERRFSPSRAVGVQAGLPPVGTKSAT